MGKVLPAGKGCSFKENTSALRGGANPMKKLPGPVQKGTSGNSGKPWGGKKKK